MSRLAYYQRIFSAYLTRKKSHLTFWHEVPEINDHFQTGELAEYYMPFTAKADYTGQFDSVGIPLLNYHGAIGLQYNPIAIAQYGLGNYNLYCRTGEKSRRSKFLNIADWLVENLEETPFGTRVWCHHFDFEYRDILKAPWYSGLAQGQGVSVLVRAHQETGEKTYLDTAKEAFETFKIDIKEGGVTYRDEEDNIWFEEYILFPPTHILNGFIWTIWGVYDYYLATHDMVAKDLFIHSIQTVKENMPRFDIGFWSLYDQSGIRLKMMASPFYHHLHIVQLRILHRLTAEKVFRCFADRWEKFLYNPIKRSTAMGYKALFKLCYY